MGNRRYAIMTRQEAIAKLENMDDTRSVFFYEAPPARADPKREQGTLFDVPDPPNWPLKQYHLLSIS